MVLRHIPKELSPELVKVLMEMGHGDEIVLADANYPAVSNAKRLIRCDGLGIPNILKSILYLFPLDTYVSKSVFLMEPEDGDSPPIIWDEYISILRVSDVSEYQIEYLTRKDFYNQSKNAFAIVATGETALYGNIILKKGVIK
ncbi:RbsD/FucU family protein [Streptococcus suis]|uniref:RbsD/FucU family protein n=1 Tax=Streptococcus suis TaxID=1307 RepID=UPI001C93FF18|nr:RbsD/FucU domain-containing protein [Streptococcus suis]MBY4990976.1 fucose isomerase [Streptococcus suis]HEM3661691.1 fucose isomerase [Streptococcus suis]HEM3676259.1 fucose isomerase [Streptococcus suis]